MMIDKLFLIVLGLLLVSTIAGVVSKLFWPKSRWSASSHQRAQDWERDRHGVLRNRNTGRPVNED